MCESVRVCESMCCRARAACVRVCLGVHLRGQPEPGLWWPGVRSASSGRDTPFPSSCPGNQVSPAWAVCLPSSGSAAGTCQGRDGAGVSRGSLLSPAGGTLPSFPVPAWPRGVGLALGHLPALSGVLSPPTHPQPCMLQPLARDTLPGLSIPTPDLSHIGIQLLWKSYRL